jgi:hypothetical protein
VSKNGYNERRKGSALSFDSPSMREEGEGEVIEFEMKEEEEERKE